MNAQAHFPARPFPPDACAPPCDRLAVTSSPDIRTLGRYGQPLRGHSGRPFRRRRSHRALIWMAVVALLVVTWLGVVAQRQQPTAAPSATTAQARDVAAAASRSGTRGGDVLAEIDGLELVLPVSSHAVIGFVEASRPESLPLAPNPAVEYHVLPSLGRGRPATSAAEIAATAGAAAVAPVDGQVVRVVEYPLAGGGRDWRVEIRPDDREDLAVVVAHLERPFVGVGAAVTAGVTVLADPRLPDAPTALDQVAGAALRHVHLEVTAAAAPEPIDPNRPAQPRQPD